VESLKQIINNLKSSHPELVSHPNFEKRLRWELIEIEVQDEETYFLEMYKRKESKENPHNLLVPVILGVSKSVDLDKEPAFKIGDFPDVDVDYLPAVRDYLKKEWAPRTFGQDNVCSIGNYGTFGLKSSFIDMVRVHGLDRGEIMKITTSMGLKDDEGQILTMDKALELYPELKGFCERHPEIETAVRKLLYRNRSMGKHAGGLIISNGRIDDFVPLVRGTDGSPVSAWVEGLHGQDLGPVGLIKFDLLVVDGLNQIATATRYVKQRNNLESVCALPGDWDWSDTAYLNDTDSLAMANEGDLKCIFQYDSDGIRALATKGGVDRFDDLVAYVSLYRPSCLQMKMDEEYVERKRGRKLYEVPEILRDAIGSTYGVLVYQEQIMQILNIVGKIPLRDCYQVIKAISKKKVDGFKKYKDKFVENGQETLGRTEKEMEEYWQLIESFAGYGFNKTLTEDTIIYCVDGSKQIKDIRAGDKVYCVNEKGEQAQTEVFAVHDHGVIDVVEVTFDDGYSVKCTLDHKFLTEEGQVPLWEIIQDNLNVLSSPLGEQNAEETKLGSELRRSIQQQKQNYRTSQDLPKVQRDIFRKENGKIQSQSTLWAEVSNQVQISNPCKGMSGLYLFEMERGGEEAYIPMWHRVFERKTAGGTSSSLRKMHGNKEEKYSRSHGQVEQGQSCSRTQGDIICNCQENLGKEGHSASKSGATEEMERQQPRRICKEYRESATFAQEIENGNVVKETSWMETEENMLRERPEICGLGKEEDLDRSGWSVSFLAGRIGVEQNRAQLGICAVQRSDAQGGMSEERECDSVETKYDLLSQQNGGNEGTVAGFTPNYAPVANSGNLVHRRVLRIVPVGKRQCYDLEVAVSTHNFILPNGVVTSNSHATAYSYISARQLYLKSHYPIEFFVSSLQSQDNDDKRRDYITEAINHGVEVMPLTLNKSKESFEIVDEKIYVGFGNIKGIGEDKAKRIVEMQPYTGLKDFMDRYGTEAGTLKTLIGLRIFGDNPVRDYAYFLRYSEYRKQFKDKEKRFEASSADIFDLLKQLLPEKMRASLDKVPKITSELFDLIIDYLNKKGIDAKNATYVGVQALAKKFGQAQNRYKAALEKLAEPLLEEADIKLCEDADEKLVKLYKSQKESEVAFYGYLWTNEVRNSSKYKPGFNFDLAKRKSISRPQPYYLVYGIITSVQVKSFKSGKGSFASIEMVDENMHTGRITVWDDDFKIFKDDLQKGNLVSMQVTVSPAYQGFTLYGPPRHKRHTLPAKKYDTRVVVLEEEQ
jgi:hypothetical protein